MFPIWDDHIPKNGIIPFVSYTFICINVLVFLYQSTLDPAWFEAFLLSFGSIPRAIVGGEQLTTLMTNMFLHGSWIHLIGNMLFLRVFGDNVEVRMGNFKFLLFYLAGGSLATVSHIIINSSSTLPAVGASGAIAAVLGAYLVMYPHSKIKMLNMSNMRVFYIPALHFLWYRILFQIISGVGDIGNTWWWTARWAHIGGFVFGYLVGKVYGKQASSSV